MSKNFMAFAADDSTHSALIEFARDLYLPEEDVVMGGVDAALDKLSDVSTPEYLFVDLANALSPLGELDRLSGVCDPGTQVIAIGEINDISVFRDMLSAGVADYLVKPVDSNRLKQSYEEAHKRLEAPAAGATAAAPQGQADVIAIVGARGGVGTSTVAANMAWILANESEKKVGLVDLDPYYGSIALSLNLDVGRSLSEALEAPDRIDDVFAERTMSKHSDNLFVLAAEESMQNEVPMDAISVETVIENLRNSFQVLIVEAPRSQFEAVKAAMRMATHIIFVSDYSVVGMRDVIRLSGLANSVAAGTRQLVVANHGLRGKSDLNAKDFEATTGVAVNADVPSDPKTLSAALNASVPVGEVAARSPVVKSLRKLCNELYEAEDDGGDDKKKKKKGKGKKKGGLFSMFSS